MLIYANDCVLILVRHIYLTVLFCFLEMFFFCQTAPVIRSSIQSSPTLMFRTPQMRCRYMVLPGAKLESMCLRSLMVLMCFWSMGWMGCWKRLKMTIIYPAYFMLIHIAHTHTYVLKQFLCDTFHKLSHIRKAITYARAYLFA